MLTAVGGMTEFCVGEHKLDEQKRLCVRVSLMCVSAAVFIVQIANKQRLTPTPTSPTALYQSAL